MVLDPQTTLENIIWALRILFATDCYEIVEPADWTSTITKKTYQIIHGSTTVVRNWWTGISNIHFNYFIIYLNSDWLGGVNNSMSHQNDNVLLLRHNRSSQDFIDIWSRDGESPPDWPKLSPIA